MLLAKIYRNISEEVLNWVIVELKEQNLVEMKNNNGKQCITVMIKDSTGFESTLNCLQQF